MLEKLLNDELIEWMKNTTKRKCYYDYTMTIIVMNILS